MKKFTTLTAVAALIVGMSFANAQNAGSTSETPPSSSINAGSQTGTGDSKSGSQSGASAAQKSTKKGVKDPSGNPPSSSINAGAQTGTGDSKSGSQSKRSANAGGKKSPKMTGKAKFCIGEAGSNAGWNCKFASMAACQKEAGPGLNKECQPNPKMAGTTGMKPKN